ncbi:MAG: hypothetical protein JNK73_10660 [Bacteroidia bacterium]|nr:hypothetical protein [Bacteroidia bacterium]
MAKPLLVFVFCLSGLFLNAQSDTVPQKSGYSGHMVLSFGYAKPLEDMASRSTYGSAKNGVGLQFLLQFPLSKRFGLCVAYDQGWFYVDQDELFKRNNTYSSPQIYGEMSSVSVDQNWGMNVLNVGGFASFPLSQNQSVNLETRFMLGACRVTSPGFSCTYATISATAPVVSYKTETLFSSKSANFPLTFLFGFGLRFDLNPDWCLAVNFDYLNVLQETEFDEVEIRNTQNQTSSSSKKMDLGYYTFRLGIGRFF